MEKALKWFLVIRPKPTIMAGLLAFTGYRIGVGKLDFQGKIPRLPRPAGGPGIVFQRLVRPSVGGQIALENLRGEL